MKDLCVVLVDGRVAMEERGGLLDVARHQRVERLVEDGDGLVSEAGQVAHGALGPPGPVAVAFAVARGAPGELQRRLFVELDDALADVHAEIADALQIGDDLQRRGDEPQVRGHRLADGEDAHGELVDLALEAVDAPIEAHGRLRQRGVARAQRGLALADHLLDEAPHEEELLPQHAQLLLVDLAGVRPGRHRSRSFRRFVSRAPDHVVAGRAAARRRAPRQTLAPSELGCRRYAGRVSAA